MNYKDVASKILHDLASPITALTFLAEDNPELNAVIEDMSWKLKALRLIFLNDHLTKKDIQPYIGNLQYHLEDEQYNKMILLLGYLFKHKPIQVKIHKNTLYLSQTLPSQERNILVSYLKDELMRLNLTLQMI